MNSPQDPVGGGGLDKFARDFRDGKISSLDATQAYLARIEALDKRLGAFQHVDHEKVLASAKAMGLLLSAGVDLGPLMGGAHCGQRCLYYSWLSDTEGRFAC